MWYGLCCICVSGLLLFHCHRCIIVLCCFFFFKQKTAYEMRISDWSSDVCSSDLIGIDLAIAQRRFDLDAAGRNARISGRDLLRIGEVRAECGQQAKRAHPGAGMARRSIQKRPPVAEAVHILVEEDEDFKIGRASCRERGCTYV